MKYRHPETGHEVEVTEQEYAATYAVQGFVPVEAPEDAPKLEHMTRAELDDRATELGIADAASLPNKAAVIEAIEGHEG